MPCNMYEGVTSGDIASSRVSTLERRVREKEQENNTLRFRISLLEEAICGLCQTLDENEMHPQLKKWFDHHKRQPGCDLNGG